jgi:hypothetical protein
MSRRVSVTALVLVLGSAACAKPPTQAECKAAITRLLEMQIDALHAPGSPASSIMRADLTEEQRTFMAQSLKAQIPSLLTSEFVAGCVERMKRSDLECTMTASTLDELVQKCHWKVVSGPRGPTLGF